MSFRFVGKIVSPVFVLFVSCDNLILAPVTSSNLSQKTEIRIKNKSIYTAKYIGGLKESFPPPGRAIDPNPMGKIIYNPIKVVDAKIIEITIQDTYSGASKEIKEMASLVAANMCVRLFYNKFTLVKLTNYHTSSVYYTANTTGQFSGDTYSGVSSLRENSTSIARHVFEYFLFNNIEDLNAGIFVQSHFSGMSDRPLFPYRELYYGTTPMDSHEISLTRPSIELPPGNNIYIELAGNAWKSHYDPLLIVAEFENKYKIPKIENFKIIDEHTENEQQQKNKKAEPLEKLKIKH